MFLDVTWFDLPKVFISSTMDKTTKVERDEIKSRLEDKGYELIAFEDNSFPYSNDNSMSIIDETINAVGKANIFVLIIDENYGTIIDDKSVVHREYLRARDLNIPIFVFIHEKVWDDFENKRIGGNSYVKSDEHYKFINDLSEYKISKFTVPSKCADELQKQLLNFLGGALKFSRNRWLWNENYTRSIESSANEVWIITPNFMWDFDDPTFKKIVVENVTERLVHYKYIFLDTPENVRKKEEMIRQYKMIFSQKGKDPNLVDELVQSVAVKKAKFLWSSEQILFNPFGLDEHAIIVDIMDVRDHTLKFNVEFGHGKRLDFRDKFIEFWNTTYKKNSPQHIDTSKYNL